jgi:CMP/dCMP kinase
MMKKINIAIDGPSAAGKSTISKTLAKELNYIHLDSGAMYRSAAYKAIQENIAQDDEEALVEMLKNTSIELTTDGRVIVDGNDVSKNIRTNDISMAASNVSKLQGVREILVQEQQEMAKSKGYIMDGRDIGTVVLKDAEVKIFLTASVESRAQRRYKQDLEAGRNADLDCLREDIEKRDYQDTHRANSPLKKADDAIEVDSSNLTKEEVVNEILNIVHKKMNEVNV